MNTPRHKHHYGDEQNQADLEKQRNTNQERQRRHHPGEAVLRGVFEERVNDLVCRAGFNQQRANNRSERDQNSDAPDRRPHSR